MRPTTAYGHDLAHIHDTGFGYVASNAAAELLKHLGKIRKARPRTRLVVDLGCGSGILAKAVSAAGYDVLGFDVSVEMLALAAERVPRAEFRRGSFVTVEIPPCVAVTATGEVFNYVFDRRNRGKRLLEVFRRVHEALEPNGLFLFDVAEPGRVAAGRDRWGYSEGSGWVCVYSIVEDRRRQTLTRTITSFRKAGDLYRRTRELHHQRLFRSAELAQQLRGLGFDVRILRRYGRFPFPPGWVGLLARKPNR